ncbi:hypothetical protein GCM10027176_78590 [Actinoallomurus bryophytorum]|uniref:Type III secretion system (T3SS) SseB-like protein n=1 Tax=Actinoallomurus bryophytorum TaxID=1490222 RepID=A0A543CFM4_9ACTN|nr:SAV_915 family protein [Actinoallomurus bryophytorum]TQL95901.1 hypothetical protein FB559_1413 [Actinoallomurus bryophytorum]
MSSPYQYPSSGADQTGPGPDTDRSLAEAVEARRRLTEGVAYVYVPTQPATETTGPRQVNFELRRLEDGTAGLPVFTELELLVAQLGEFQPWERIAVLELLIQISAARIPVVVNPVVQDGADRWTAAGIDAWSRSDR